MFEGRIVVCGGWDNNINTLNTVETYDVVADKWSSMPNMIQSKRRHSLVAVRNKLFVIAYGSDICEVYEDRSKKFVALKSPPVEDIYLNKAISIGSKIFVFQDNKAAVLCYDVDKNEWSEESCEITKFLEFFCCVTIPIY